MRATEWSDRVLDNWVGLLVDTVSVLISLSAATAIRFGTLGVTQYLGPLWPAVILLVGVRLGFLQALGLHNAPATVFGRRRVISLVAAVALSSLITAFLILGLTAPFGRTGWFPFTILLLELPLGVICGAAVRLGWRIWEQSIVPKWAPELEVLRSRAGTIVSGLFIALAVVVLWQAVGLAAALLPGTWESVLAGFRVSILSAVLFLVPGYALLAVARPRMDLGPLEGLIVSAGLSVAVVPLLLYFSSLAGMELNSFSVGAIFLLLGALALGRSLPQMRRMVGNSRLRSARRGWRVPLGQVRSLWKGGITEGQAFYTALALVFLMAFLVRFYVVRDLSVGMWADSYHHTMISQLLVDNGGLFSSWEPYAPLSSFTYHFGFHSLAAFYHWLTGVPVGRSVIDVGQVLNGLAVPLMYVLTERLTRSRWAGLWAAVVVAFLSPMPMYYVNWGRYTQLAGQTILPVAMLLTLKGVSREDGCWRAVLVGGVAVSGLILTHYRVALMYVPFALVALVLATWTAYRDRDARSAVRPWLNALAMAAIATVLVSPWIWNIGQGLLPQHAAATMEKGACASGIAFLGEIVGSGYIFFFLPGYLFLLSLLGTVAGIAERRAGPNLVSSWIAALVCLVVLVPLPGGDPSQNVFTVLIALYLPAAVLSGYLVGRLLHAANARVLHAGLVGAVVIVLAVLVMPGDVMRILNPENRLLTEADERAMDWITNNTGYDARFLVNSSFWGGSVLGTDGGWWIPLLTGRENTVPPMLYGAESSFEPDYVRKVGDLNRAIHDSALDDPETLRLLRENGVTHVYIGEKGGNLQPEFLANSPCYETVYHEDKVWVFGVLYKCVGVG